jgi:hypothetical protein
MDERDEALKVDIGNLPMPADQRQRLLNAQIKLHNNATKDPNMGHALNVIQDMTRGVIDKTKDPDEYNEFYGRFRSAIEGAQEAKGAPLKDDEVREIAQNQLKEIYTQGIFYGQNLQGRQYQMPVPEKFKSAIIEQAQKDGVEAPTDREIYEAYNHLTYQKLYAKKLRSNGGN